MIESQPLPPGDEDLLANLLERFLDQLRSGQPIDPEAALPDRPDLREAVRRTRELAEALARAQPKGDDDREPRVDA